MGELREIHIIKTELIINKNDNMWKRNRRINLN